MTDIAQTLSRQIRKARLAKGMSVLELARATGLSATRIYKAENRDLKLPPVYLVYSEVKKIAQVLGVPPNYLLCFGIYKSLKDEE